MRQWSILPTIIWRPSPSLKTPGLTHVSEPGTFDSFKFDEGAATVTSTSNYGNADKKGAIPTFNITAATGNAFTVTPAH